MAQVFNQCLLEMGALDRVLLVLMGLIRCWSPPVSHSQLVYFMKTVRQVKRSEVCLGVQEKAEGLHCVLLDQLHINIFSVKKTRT